jgi:hypothetical protein
MKPRTHRRSITIAVFAIALLVVILGGANVALAAQGASTTSLAQTSQVERQVIVEFGDPVVVRHGERVETVVSIGGDVTIAGTVDKTVVTVGGDVTLLSTANVGRQASAQEASIVLINGDLTRQNGAQVTGDIQTVDIGNVGEVWEWASERGGWSAFSPFASFVGWLVATVVFLLLGLLAAAIMPAQIRAVERQVAKRPGGSLGWGALTVLIIVPVSLVVLTITVIGLLVVLPAIALLPFFTFFVVTAVGTFVIERLFGDRLKGNLMAAVAIAVGATSVVVRVPVLGSFVLIAMVFIGTGAAVLAWNGWRLERRALREGGAPAGGFPGGTSGAPPQGPVYTPQGVPVTQGYAQAPGAPQAAGQQGIASYGQPPYAQPPYGQAPYAPSPYAQAPYAQPPMGQAPVGTQAYLHPQYGWLVYPPPAQTLPPEGWTAGAPPVAEVPTAATGETAVPGPADEAPEAREQSPDAGAETTQATDETPGATALTPKATDETHDASAPGDEEGAVPRDEMQ